MIEEDFYATLKIKTGEEIFAKVAVTNEDTGTFLLLSNPVIISHIIRNSFYGYKFEPWIKTSKEDFFIINLNDVILISESDNEEIIKMYNMFISELNSSEMGKISDNNFHKLNKKMGYINNITDAKDLLERIYKNN
jgi:hypothetical protein